MVSTKDYLNLSALAYVDFEGVDKGKTIGSLADSIKDGTISRKEFDLDRPELSALKNKSNPLRSWKLLDFKNSGFSGFYAIALQNPDTKEIVFSFRGTNNIMNVDIFTDIGIGIFVPHFLHLQFVDAKNFVFDILNKYGSTHYDNQEGMLKALNQDSKVSFTGHSLGGGLAQYMTYVTSDMESNDIGVKSVTFNGVGIGQNTWDIEIWGNGYRYNSTNHINSGDFTGNYGMGLGRPIYHVDALSGVRSQSVNVKALATMLMYKVYSLTGKNRNIDYLAKIKNIQKSLKDGDERRSTMLAYEGFFGGGGGSGIVRFICLIL